jgi:LSD1 subclass zinc finger protein
VTQTECGACHATTDAPLCRPCTDQLAAVLTKLPGLIRDLEVTVTRQARLGESSQQVDTQVGSIRAYLELRRPDWPEERKPLPAHLRSLLGRITLPETQMPVALGAALLHRQAVAGVLSWARQLNVIGQTTGQLCTGIRRRLDDLRQLDTAGEIHAKAIDMAAAIEATIDRRDPDTFAGRCDATGVRIDQQHLTGPPCSGLWCRHETCDQIRGGAHRLSVVAGECGEELNAPAGATSITCAACGTQYDVTAQKAKLADKLTEQLGSVREVAGFLRTLELDVTVDKIDGWLRRGRILDHGTGPHGRLVKVGEVRAYAEQQAERAKSRRAGRVEAQV